MYYYCLGIRIDDVYAERACTMREKCPYYCNNNLGIALSHPEQYQELDTYNNKTCKYFDKNGEEK